MRSRWWIGIFAAPSSTVISTSILSRVFIHRPRTTTTTGLAPAESRGRLIQMEHRPPMLTEALTTDPICDTGTKLWRQDGAPVEWRISDGLVPYPDALEAMRARAAAIANGEAGEQGWLLEHPPPHTAGTPPGAPGP